MVGFALIVVVVVVGLMVFLIMSVNNTPESENSFEADRLLSSIMRQTTDCAISFEPKFDNFEDLFKSCYDNDQCSNLDQAACEYLNESLLGVVTDLLKSDAAVSAYQVDFLQRDDGGEQGVLRIFEGNCTGRVSSAQRDLVSGSEKLIVRMKICS